ncbi:MAG TPA: aminodeoxychorismate/anthranilate synthase component II [Candidatus Gastranaerophilales bacterium]|nr:aminodeoxychorismate/anthranilate synthase component II [Candidatus Gastranaerophilales bacterium]
MILVIDNYDSFTYNLVQYLGKLGAECAVYRNDQLSVNDAKKLKFSHLIISPGPGTPDEAGISKDLIVEFADKKPILGVCLGHQAIGEVFDAKVTRAPYLMHGKTSQIFYNDNDLIFKNIENPFIATRYHSLVVDYDSVENTSLKIIAKTSDNIVMGLRHKEYNVIGIQFHPESILTKAGYQILSNFYNS